MPKDKPSARARRNSKGSKAVHAPRKEEPEPCPSCPAGQLPHVSDPNVLGEFVGCEKCLAWHHWVCVSPADVPIETCLKVCAFATVLLYQLTSGFSQWYCQECLQQASSSSQPLQIEWRDAQNTRRSSRGTTISATALNYANLDQGFASDPTRFHKIAQSKPITPHNFRKMHGKDLTAEWLWSDPSAMTEPIIIESPEGLDLKVPRDISQHASCLGDLEMHADKFTRAQL